MPHGQQSITVPDPKAPQCGKHYYLLPCHKFSNLPIDLHIYNKRLQPILLSASVASTPIFSLCYDFHLGVAISSPPCSIIATSTGNNGNVFQVLNNVDSSRSATFQYDALNRISQANTITTTGANCWGETYLIDAWANMYARNGVTGMTGCKPTGW